MSQDLIVGVDGGGTKTTALAARLDGQILRQSSTGPSNHYAIGFETACRAIELAIEAVLQEEKLVSLCLGLAGVGRQEDMDQFLAWAHGKFQGIPLTVVNDAQILLAAGAPSGLALALVCGTGSIAYGRTAEGLLVRAGGWGYLFGDEGSGYAIGAAALKAIMWAEDGRGEPTKLTGLVLDRKELKTPQDLIRSIYTAGSPRTEIAGLADLVELAAAQDAVARSILDQAANDLALIVLAVYQKLGSNPVPLALTGGTILNGAYLSNAFYQVCARLGIAFTSIKEVKDPAEGALLLARQLLNL